MLLSIGPNLLSSNDCIIPFAESVDIRVDTVHECDRQTDNQADGRTDRHPDDGIASRGKNGVI